MLQKYKNHIWLMSLTLLFVVLSACGAGQGNSPQQTLANSATAMSKLNSVHFTLQTTISAQSTTSSGGVTATISGNGDVVRPNKVTAKFMLGQNQSLAVISTGDKVYVQENNGTWYVTNASTATSGMQKVFSQDLLSQLSSFITILKDATLTDHGNETVNGTSLDHITVTLDSQTLQALSSQINSLLPGAVQSNQNAINQASLDLWIDPTTSYIHQANLSLAVHLDLSKVPALSANGQTVKLPATVQPATVKLQLNLSNFNESVTINAPANAQPLPQS